MGNIPEELLKHKHWVFPPERVGNLVFNEENWGYYNESLRYWFVLTPDLGIVCMVFKEKGQHDGHMYAWGYGKLPDGVSLLKVTSQGFIITNNACLPVYGKYTNGKPFGSMQKGIDKLVAQNPPKRQASGPEFQREIEKGFNKFVEDS